MSVQSIANFDSGKLRIIPFGGCGEFGMNFTAYIIEDRIYLVDAGVSFPDPSKLGVEAIYPDLDPWLKQFGGVYAYIITHGHEDHIGAMPYMLKKWPGPVYATPWTAALIRNKLQRREVSSKYDIIEVQAGDVVQTEDFTVEYVHVNHSIPHACALLIKTPNLKVLHTGDFKFDYTPIGEKTANLTRLKEIGDSKVDLLLADSTNAHIPGPSPSETVVIGPMKKAFELAPGAVLVTTFSSNLWRLKTILDTCEATGRKALVLGTGIETSLNIASELGLYKAPPGLIVDPSTSHSLPRKKLAVLLTGSQGEWRSALMRLALGEHKLFSILPDDLVVFSSRTIPGNERVIQTMMSLLERRGARIYSARDDKDIHVSGHAYRDDLKTMISAIKPKAFIPIHGTFSHMNSNGRIPDELGLKSTKTYLVENGDIIDLTASGVELCDRLSIDHKFVESESYISIDYENMRERLRIGELGVVVVTMPYDSQEQDLCGDPKITIQGLGSPDGMNPSDIEKGCQNAAKKSLRKALEDKVKTEKDLTERVRVDVRRYLAKTCNKKPVVIVHIHSIV
jgi:ribonuclease J